VVLEKLKTRNNCYGYYYGEMVVVIMEKYCIKSGINWYRKNLVLSQQYIQVICFTYGYQSLLQF